MRGRPGILTAVGIISLCVGALGVLSNAASIFQTVMFAYVMPMTAPAVAPAPTPASRPTAAVVPTAPSAAPFPATAPATFTFTTTVTTTTTPSTTTTPPPTTAPAAGGFAGPILPFIDKATADLAFTEAAVAFALAVFLVVLGVLVFRDAPFARRGHLIWAYLKFPAALLAAWSTWAMTRSMMAGISAAMPPGTPAVAFADSMALVQAVFAAVISCLYPIAVLIVMHTKTVKNFYAAGAGAALR